ncbi:adhesion G-protein coupled receptor G7-like [Styela clava]
MKQTYCYFWLRILDGSRQIFLSKIDAISTVELGDLDQTVNNIKLQNTTVEIEGNYLSDTEISSDQYLSCMYWDVEQSYWTTAGCQIFYSDNTAYPTTCKCDHLTSFAVLVMAFKDLTKCGLDALPTGIGCLISIGGLVVTFICIVAFKKLRSRSSMHIILHLCFCLASSYSIFVAGIEPRYTENNAVVREGLCNAMTIMLHFFLLCSWCWMAVYAHSLWFKIVRGVKNFGKSYNVLLACVFAYGVPTVIVALNAGIVLGHIDKMKNNDGNSSEEDCQENNDDQLNPSEYRSDDLCWLTGLSLIVGFLTPVIILLLYNIAVFIAVFSKLTCLREKISSSKKDQSFPHHLLNAVALTTTMGFSWASAFLMLLVEDDSEGLCAMAWIFSIVTSLQGFLIFLLVCVRELVRFIPHKRPYSDALNQPNNGTGSDTLPANSAQKGSKEK